MVSENYSFDTTGQTSASLTTSFTSFADVLAMTNNSHELANFSGNFVTGFELAPQVSGKPGKLSLNLDIPDLLLRIAAVTYTEAQAEFSLDVTSPQIGTLFATTDAMLYGPGGASFVSTGDISPGQFGDFMSGNDIGKTLTNFVLDQSFNLPANEPIDITISFTQNGFSGVGVPEPPGITLLLAGLLGLLWRRRPSKVLQPRGGIIATASAGS